MRSVRMPLIFHVTAPLFAAFLSVGAIAGQRRKYVDPLTLRLVHRRSQKDTYDTRASVGIKLKRVRIHRREIWVIWEANVIALPILGSDDIALLRNSSSRRIWLRLIARGNAYLLLKRRLPGRCELYGRLRRSAGIVILLMAAYNLCHFHCLRVFDKRHCSC